MRTNQASTAVRPARSLTPRSRRGPDMRARSRVGVSCSAIGRLYLISIMLTISIIVRFGMLLGLQSAAIQYLKSAILIADGARAKPKISYWIARGLQRRETGCPAAPVLIPWGIYGYRIPSVLN